MPQTSPPWRVLEEPASAGAPFAVSPTQPGTSSAGGTGGAAAVGKAAVGHPQLPAVAAFVAAGLLVLAAFLIAAQSDSGMVEVSAVAPSSRPASSAAGGAGAPSASPEAIVVEVAGAVVRPGLYTLPRGARAGDAIAAAGGYGPRVDAELASLQLNLAAVLRDGERVRVPSRDDPIPGGAAIGQATAAPADPGGARGSGGGIGSAGAGDPVNLNGATAAELEALPGIGPATATKIISARAQRPFSSVDELVERKLVSTKVLESLRGLIAVR